MVGRSVSLVLTIKGVIVVVLSSQHQGWFDSGLALATRKTKLKKVSVHANTQTAPERQALSSLFPVTIVSTHATINRFSHKYREPLFVKRVSIPRYVFNGLDGSIDTAYSIACKSIDRQCGFVRFSTFWYILCLLVSGSAASHRHVRGKPDNEDL